MCCIIRTSAYNNICQQVTKQVTKQVVIQKYDLKTCWGTSSIAYLLHSYIRTFANVCQQVSQQVEQQKQEVKRMAAEEQLEVAKQNVERNIKKALFDKNMTQVQIAKLIGESRQNVNRAIKGGTLPRDVEIRKRIYKVLGME